MGLRPQQFTWADVNPPGKQYITQKKRGNLRNPEITLSKTPGQKITPKKAPKTVFPL